MRMRFNRMVTIQCIFIVICHMILVCLGGYCLLYPKTNFKNIYFSMIMLTINTLSYGSHGLNIIVYLLFNKQFRQRTTLLFMCSNTDCNLAIRSHTTYLTPDR